MRCNHARRNSKSNCQRAPRTWSLPRRALPNYYCTADARCDAIELRYQTEEELGPYEYPWLEDDEWTRLDDERSDIEEELDELFNTVIGFDYEIDPFKK